LEAESLCVTSDFLLWRFDRLQSRKMNLLPTMLLPNQLLQLVRPFVAITPDFDRSFADAFAIPEFRALGHGGAAATSRFLEILAAHENVSERVATSLLTNDLFLDGLAERKDADIYAYVDSAISAENALLAKERDKLAQQVAEERSLRESAERNAKTEIEKRVAEALTERERLADADLQRLDERRVAEVAEQSRLRIESERRAELEKERADEAERRILAAEADLAAQRSKTEQSAVAEAAAVQARRESRRRLKLTALGVGVGMLTVLVAEVVFYLANWTWLLEHPNGYGIRGCIACCLIAISLAAFRRDWWGRCIAAIALPAFFVLLQIVGGRHSTATPFTPPSPPTSAGRPK
jgi:hypothetical protein